jgi:hypothetical protein
MNKKRLLDSVLPTPYRPLSHCEEPKGIAAIVDSWNRHTELWMLGIAIVSLLCALVVVAVKEKKADEAFAAFRYEHHCTKVRATAGKTVAIPSFGTNGNFSMGTAHVSGQTCWKCDDGVEYCK